MSIEDRSTAVAKTAPLKHLELPRPPLRLILPTLIALIFWVIINTATYGEFSAFARFITRLIATLALLVFSLAWWLASRHFRLRDRFLVLFATIVAMGITLLAADASIDIFGLLLTALPFLISIGLAWLWISSRNAAQTQRNGLFIAIAVVFSAMLLVRWEGLDGRQRSEFSWRWSDSAEKRFLQARDKRATSVSIDAKAWEAQPGDWLSFRGGERESVVTGVKLSDWEKYPPQLVWKRRVGPGWSSMIVVDGHLVTQEQAGDAEIVSCYHADRGEQEWSHEDPIRFEEHLSGAGPRGTPTFASGKIYTYGALGRLNCLDPATGKAIWSKEVLKETEAATPQWGLSVSPLVVDDLVVVWAGGKNDQGLLAYRASSGELVWKTPAGPMTYASPQVVTLDDQRQIVMHDNQTLFGVSIQDGKRLWEIKNPSEVAQPMLQPHILQPENNSATYVALVGWGAGIAEMGIDQGDTQWKLTEPVWTTEIMKPSFNDFVIHKGHIYGLNDGILTCLDSSGKRLWKKGRYGFGQILLLPDIDELLVLTEKGEVVRVAADSQQHTEKGRFQAIEGKTWNHPVIAHGKLYIRNSEEMACYDLAP